MITTNGAVSLPRDLLADFLPGRCCGSPGQGATSASSRSTPPATKSPHETGRRARAPTPGLTTATAWPLSLGLQGGVTVALSGHGSSEVLRVIAGPSPSTGGAALVDDTPVTAAETAVDLGVVLIPQGGGLATLLTAYENLALPLPLPLLRHDPATASAEAHDALAAVGLDASAHYLFDELSRGQQQSIAIARALSQRPRVLLANQVTTDLDPGNCARVLALFQAQAHDGDLVVLARDDPTVTRACDRVIDL